MDTSIVKCRRLLPGEWEVGGWGADDDDDDVLATSNFGKWIAPRESMYNRFCFGLPASSSSLSLPLFPSLYRYIHAFIESFYLKAP